MKAYRIDNFSKGMIRDATLVETKPVLRTIKNYRYDYDGDLVKLLVRKGYDNFNANVLSNAPQQLYLYRDLENNEHLLGIVHTGTPVSEYRWYDINETGTNIPISEEEATPRKHAMSFLGRAFLGTDGTGSDIGWRWADNTSILAGVSYRVGIKKPDEVFAATAVAVSGHTVSVASIADVELNTTTRRRIGIKLTLTETTKMASISVGMNKPTVAASAGNVRIIIYNDSGGSPGTTVVDTDAYSSWWPVAMFNVEGGPLANDLRLFTFLSNFELAAGTYWAVIVGDNTYYDNYNAAAFYANMVYDQPGGTGYVKLYNNGTSTWTDSNYQIYYQINGLDDSKFYDYVMTYYNSTYGIESRPSDPVRIDPAASLPAIELYGPTPGDAQVDKIRFYRRYMDNADDSEADITDTYKYVGETAIGNTLIDNIPTENLGADLQTQNHYCFDDTDDSGEELRDAALVPHVVTAWKDRIWFAEQNKNILYFSKILEEDGATGWTGKAIPDYFPLGNKIEIPESSSIIGLMQLSDDSLVIYFKNGAVWILEGGNDIYNPPSDFALRQVLTDTGLLAQAGLDSIRGRHVYLAQEGVYSFSGTSDPVYLSQEVQSIFDAVQTSYLDDTIIATMGEEIWVLYDSNNDGVKDKILVLNILRSSPTWRLYDFGRGFNDIVVRSLGNTFRTVLAADATTGYVWELENGTTDNGLPIETEIETHEIRAGNRLSITGVELDGYYPNVPAQYQVTIAEHNGRTNLFSIMPSDSEDIRGHRTGCRITTGPTAKVKIQGRSVNEDKLISLQIEYEER
jgi:hypothetical protein